MRQNKLGIKQNDEAQYNKGETKQETISLHKTR